MANIDIKGGEDCKLYFHTSREGNVWLDGKDKPIPLDQTLVSHVDSISPIELWNSRCTRKSIHPKGTPPKKGGTYNSTTVDKNTPAFNTPLSPISETAVNMPHPHNLPEVGFSVDKLSNQQIGTEPKYNLRRAIKALTKLDL